MPSTERLRSLTRHPIRTDGDFVLYWMQAHRRLAWNHALDRAVGLARELGKPLLIAETLTVDGPWDTRRSHQFILEGMRVQVTACTGRPVSYLPIVETSAGQAQRLIRDLAGRAAVVVAEDCPRPPVATAVEHLARRIPVALEAVDGEGLLPLAAGRACARAVDFRRHWQKTLPGRWGDAPSPDPLRRLSLPRLPDGALPRLPLPDADDLPVDQQVGPGALDGGRKAALRRLTDFLVQDLPRYAEDRNQVERPAASGLSAWLHHGHLSAHEVVQAVLERAGWSPERLGASARGAKAGWWGLDPSSEAFLDQILTWRELGIHTCRHAPGWDHYTTAVPEWARRTLATHRPRRDAYDHRFMNEGTTGDRVWNAAQRQLMAEGLMPGYLRMLWGKKVLEWSRDPEAAFDLLVELNNRYALDGDDPNSWSGIAWVFGRFDRPWAPARPGFGTVRCMTSASACRKLRLKAYLDRWCPADKDDDHG